MEFDIMAKGNRKIVKTLAVGLYVKSDTLSRQPCQSPCKEIESLHSIVVAGRKRKEKIIK